MEPIIIALAGFLAAAIKSSVGLGAGVLIAPVLALFLEPRLAVGMTAPVMFLTSLTSLREHWLRWDWPLLRRLLPSALLGLMIGSLFLAWAPAEQLRRTIGVVALLFALSQLGRLFLAADRSARWAAEKAEAQHEPRASTRASAPLGSALACGLVGGVVSGIAHSGGLLFSLYLLPRLTKVAFVASLTMTLLVIDSFRLLSYGYLGVLQLSHLLWALLFTPVMIAGSRVGRLLNNRLSEQGFLQLIVGLVAVTGIALLMR